MGSTALGAGLATGRVCVKRRGTARRAASIDAVADARQDGEMVMAILGREDPLLRAVLLAAGGIIIAAGLRDAAPLVNAVLLAALLALTLLPAKQALMRRGLSRNVAVAIILAIVVGGGVLLVAAVVAAIADFTAQA